MKLPIRTLSIAVLLAAATVASAQAPGTNPGARTDRDSFFYGKVYGSKGDPSLNSPLNSGNAIGRPVGRYGPVTPVPEPSQWAMMLAGFALVGFIARRGSKRD